MQGIRFIKFPLLSVIFILLVSACGEGDKPLSPVPSSVLETTISEPTSAPEPTSESEPTSAPEPTSESEDPPHDDPRQEELNGFRKALSDNKGPGCNVWSEVLCPKFPNFVKTKPGKKDLPVYKATVCEGSFNDEEYKLKTPKDSYVACLINASKTDQKPYLVSGALIDPIIKKEILEAQEYGAEIFGNWGPVLNTLVRYGEPDVEYVAAQTCLYIEKYGSPDAGLGYNGCFEYNHLYYQNFDACCGALHGTPEPLAPVRIQTMTFSAPEAAHKEGFLKKVTLHEYVHVWQTAHLVHPHGTRCSDEENTLCELGNGPLWLEEGSAEYFANFYAEKKGWGDLKGSMTGALESAQKVYDKWGFTLKNSHARSDKDKLDQHECQCGGSIMYDMGLWGIVWLIDTSGTNDGFLKEFYPKVAYIGYEQAFKNAFGLTLNEFYNEFGKWFAQTSPPEKLKILDKISKY